uniref:Uncharacterized protein n=1 Tax=Lepeophtheirus salmonis TaxID=72036 RepID=A0A0K2UJX9_LEPSM
MGNYLINYLIKKPHILESIYCINEKRFFVFFGKRNPSIRILTSVFLFLQKKFQFLIGSPHLKLHGYVKYIQTSQ